MKLILLAIILIVENVRAQTGATTVASGGTGAGGCTWTPTADRNTPNGVQQSSATSLALCQSLCAASVSCQVLGFDFNPQNQVGAQCFFSTSSAIGQAIGITHYNYTCTGGTGGTGSGTGATNIPTCNFAISSNQHTTGGINQPTATTLDLCKSQCLASSSCITLGFDFNSAAAVGFKCWFSTAWQLGALSGTDHYNVSCSGSTGTGATPGGNCDTVDSNKNTAGGILQPQSSLDACKQACLAVITNNCTKGFDFNPLAPAGQNCWFSTSTTLNSAPGISHYTCVAGSQTTGIPLGNCDTFANNSNSLGGIMQTYTTFVACKDACLSGISTNCKFGFDWNPQAPSGSQCWFSTQSALNTAQGIYHYTCVASDTSTGQPTGNCDSFTNDTNTLGGVMQPQLSLAACKAACLASISSTCKYGFDWDPSAASGSQCWFSTTTTTNKANGVFHFTCTSTSTVTGNCDIFTNDTNTNGGVVQPQFSLAACKAACLASISTTCKYGFDWDPLAANGSQCWFSTTATTNKATGVFHFTCTLSSTPTGNCDTKMANTNTIGGVKQSGITTLDACKSACLASSNCTTLGFDFDGSCWFSTTATTQSAIGVDHYTCTVVTPPPVCYNPIYSSYLDPTVKTLNDCYSKCKSIPACNEVGFYWDSSKSVGYQCYLSDEVAKINATIKHYVEDRNCVSNGLQWYKKLGACIFTNKDYNVAGSTQLANVTTIDQCKTLCLQTKLCLGFDWVVATNKCSWSLTNSGTTLIGTNHYSCLKGICTETKGQKILGGTLVPNMFSHEMCKYHCLNSAACTNGYDWDYSAANGSQCFISPANIASEPASNVSHFTCLKAVNDACWTISENYNAATAIPIKAANTLDDCKSSCKANPNCATLNGFDWNPIAFDGYKCNFATSDQLVYSPGNYHFRYTCAKNCVEMAGKKSAVPVLKANDISYEECKKMCLAASATCTFGINYKIDQMNNLRECYFANADSTTTDPLFIYWKCTAPLA